MCHIPDIPGIKSAYVQRLESGTAVKHTAHIRGFAGIQKAQISDTGHFVKLIKPVRRTFRLNFIRERDGQNIVLPAMPRRKITVPIAPSACLVGFQNRSSGFFPVIVSEHQFPVVI